MNFKKTMRKLFFARPSSVLGIDLGTEFVKIVQADLKGKRPQVRDFVISELPANLKATGLTTNKEEMASFLHDLIYKHGFSTKYAVFSISGRNAFVREINMPVMSEEELKQAVLWDSGQYVPYEADTYYIDYAKIGSLSPDGQQPIVLVASPKEIVNSIVEIGDYLGLKLLKLDIDVLSICRTLDDDYEQFILLDIGMNYSMMTIFQNGAPVAQRALHQDWKRFSEVVAQALNIEDKAAEALLVQKKILQDVSLEFEMASDALKEVVNALMHECSLTSDYYVTNKRDAATFTHLILTGVGSNLPGLEEYIGRDADFKVIKHDILATVDFDSKFEQAKVRNTVPVLAVAIGAALAGGESDD